MKHKKYTVQLKKNNRDRKIMSTTQIDPIKSPDPQMLTNELSRSKSDESYFKNIITKGGDVIYAYKIDYASFAVDNG